MRKLVETKQEDQLERFRVDQSRGKRFIRQSLPSQKKWHRKLLCHEEAQERRGRKKKPLHQDSR